MLNTAMQNCIDLCQECHDTCEETLFTHCINMGGEHIEESHIKIMQDCIQICQVAADFMRRTSEYHHAICAACVEICEACAESCEDIDDETMEECAEICSQCADACRTMGQPKKVA